MDDTPIPAAGGVVGGTRARTGGNPGATGVAREPAPVANERAAVWDLVIADMRARDEAGAAHYGTRLQPFDGRDPLVEAYQEALDLCVYLRQAIEERLLRR